MKSSLYDILNLDKKGIISLIGAGGKTSLMYCLAKELERMNKRVLTTTTTKIFKPGRDESPDTIITDNFDELIKASKLKLRQYNHFSAASAYDTSLGKLIGYSFDIIDRLQQADIFDGIIVESDGAKQKPIKTTDDHEPVIPKRTNHLISVTGLDAVGTILDDKHVHRAKLFSKRTGLNLGDTVNEKAIATSIAFEIKKAKKLCHPLMNTVLLNKADTPERIISGEKIVNYLQSEKTIHKIIIASLKDKDPVKRHFFSQAKD
ncbi:MAG: putative selenium-dependent hydroxylase accessory protein YqeC [Desulfobacteraceae bacterium]|nr:putative selenium-dependent hydroxylase accessory protein YqeC [Desulfobacteraceae bacterium]